MLTKTTVASSSTLACFQIGVLQKTSKLSNVPENGEENRQYSGPILRKLEMRSSHFNNSAVSFCSLSLSLGHSIFYNQTREEEDARSALV